MSLRKKLLAMFFGLGIVPIVLIAAGVTVTAYRYAERRTQQALGGSLNTFSEIITEELEGQRFTMDLLARDLAAYQKRTKKLRQALDPGVIKLFTRPDLYMTPVGLQHLILESGKKTAEVSGRGRGASVPVRDLPDIYSQLLATERVEWKEASTILTGFHSTGPVLAVAGIVPETDEHSTRFMVTEYPLLEFLEEILRRPAFHSLEFVFAAARSSGSKVWRVLYHPDPTLLALPFEEIEFPGKVEVLLGECIASAPLPSETVGGLSKPDAQGGPWRGVGTGDSLYACGIHPLTGWLLGASASLSTRLDPIRKTIRTALILLGLLVILVTFGIFHATRGVGRAVEAIAGTTAAIASGDFNRTLLIRRSDEFGVIAGHINQMSQELMISAESRAIARISARLLHDLKGVASQLNLLLYNLRENQDDPEFQGECFSLMQDLVGQVEAITLQLRRGGEERKVSWGRVNPDEVVSKLLQSPTVGSHKDLIVRMDLRSETPVITDRELLAEILQNIVSNAVEAMGGKGVLRVRTGRIADSERSPGNGPTHFIEVEDSGPGMNRQFIQNDLYRPFVTTKSKGIGLGMYTVREVLTRLGGRIQVDSREGMGTKVRVEVGREEGEPS